MEHSHESPTHSLLRVKGAQIVDANEQPIMLKGAGLGGHLNMENFITGYSGHEHEHRAAMVKVLGKEKAEFFFSRLLDYFFTDDDAAFFASLGLNCVRVPFNYRHFLDDQDPDTIQPGGFKLLDNIVEICRRHGLYVILDLHSVPGGQNQDWHCDSGLPRALFWEHRVFQDQVIFLWTEIAKHYVGEPVIAGYNPLNEPADETHSRLLSFYDRVERAIRSVDPDHMLFLDGNTYAMDFSHFKTVHPNTAYACHDYAVMGFPNPNLPLYTGTQDQIELLQRHFDRKSTFSREHGVPLWNGEFGPVYETGADSPETSKINNARIEVLREQLRIYKRTGTSWSIWLYKDIGHQGMIHVAPDSPWMKLISAFVEKKQRLGLDAWGVVDKSGLASTYKPFVDALTEEIPEHLRMMKYPKGWSFGRYVERSVRECLLSEFLTMEFAELFAGKSNEELDALAASFKFENCVKRDYLNNVLTADVASERA